MTATYATTLDSPLGTIHLLGRAGALTGLYLDERPGQLSPVEPDEGRLDDAVTQVEEYLAGERTTFDLDLAPTGTPFQRAVWDALGTVGYGETASYVDIARHIGQPTASRAVGSANGRNPISIVIPCHRVIAASGGLGGYGWGLDRKRWLLEHEQRVLATPRRRAYG